MLFQSRHRHVLGVVLLALCLGIASARPLEHNPLARARRETTSTAVATSSDSQTSTSQAPTRSRSHTVTNPRHTDTTSRSELATSTPSTTPLQASAAASSNTHSSGTSPATSSILPSSTSTASALATSSPRSTNIFSADSPYRSYAIAVTIVVAIFGALILILLIRFLAQRFRRKPQPEPITGAGGWRYSRDSDPYYGPQPNSASPTQTTQTTPDMRHKDISDAQMSERHAFLSTDSVTLYPAGKPDNEPTRYNDEGAEYTNRMRSFSTSSSGSQTGVPFVARRPASMSFLHSPAATHPAFIVHPGSDASHSDEAQQSNLRAVPEEPAAVLNMASLLLSRAGHSEPYRQQTLAPGTTDLSRAASTASAYSQQSAYSPPPVPVLPAQYARPSQTQLSPDISAALSSMQRSRNGSTDSLRTFKTTAPPTEEGTAAPSAIPREQPGRAGWAGRAPSSTHGLDLYFGHP